MAVSNLMPVATWDDIPEPTAEEAERTRILLVDDDERNLVALVEVLSDIAEVVPVRSGEEALRHLLRGRFAVIVLDVLMPGLDGYETAKLIRAREQSRDIPIIFLTAINKEDAHLLRGYDSGAVDYVFKPVEPTIVRSKVSVFVSLYEKTLEIARNAAAEQKLLEEKLLAERERNLALEDLRISEERQSLVLSALPMAVYVKDEAGARPRFVAGNVALLTGYQPAAFEADPELWATHIHPEDGVELKAGNGHLERSIEYRWKHADGSYRHFLDQSVRASTGDFIAGTLRDVTEQRFMQDQLLQAQKMEALGKLTGGIAHDFNNLLASVLSGLALIERRAKLDGSASELLGMTRHAAEHGRELVTRLLTFSRRQKLVPQVVDLAVIQSSLGSMLAPMLGGLVELDWQLAPDLWNTYVDAPQLELVLMNLAINARDAMPDGGTIVLSIANESSPGADDLAPGDYVRIAISDTGHGIPPEILSKVIEPFFTTKDVGKGTGLGLSMAYGFAQQSGGALRIESRVGHGTSVSLWLPRSHVDPVQPAAPQHAGERPAPRSPHRRILLVDDSPSLRALTEMQLQQEGYEVTAASGGGDALAFIERDPAAFDVIVTDFAMPLMSGLELIRRARTLQPDYPAVIITGYANGPELSDHTENVEVVLKPFSSTALDRAVQTVLRRRPGRDAGVSSSA